MLTFVTQHNNNFLLKIKKMHSNGMHHDLRLSNNIPKESVKIK